MARVTEPGIVLGTVGYMAPEQVRGERSDHRADIFALGCILHEMLTGRRAFERGTAAETMTAILREEPSPPVSGIASVPPAVERILSRCLEKRPEERFQSARDSTFALESSLDARSGSTSERSDQPDPAAMADWCGAAGGRPGLGRAIGAFAVRRLRPVVADSAAPQFRQLTFDRGTIRDARFGPTGARSSTAPHGAARRCGCS